MDEGRLAAVRRYSKYNRKFVYVMNDIIRSKQDLYEHCLSREQHEAKSRLVAEVVDMRKAVVRKRVLLQCLHMRREKASNPSQLGVYCGRSLDSFSRDIDQTIAWHHPRLRRLRQVDRMKQKCLEKGAILDEITIKGKLDDFFSRSLDKENTTTTRRKIKMSKSKSRGHLYLDEDSDLDLKKLHDPIGAAKITLKFSPLGQIAGLRPNYREDELRNSLNGNSHVALSQEKTHQRNEAKIDSPSTNEKNIPHKPTNGKPSLSKSTKPLPAIGYEKNSITVTAVRNTSQNNITFEKRNEDQDKSLPEKDENSQMCSSNDVRKAATTQQNIEEDRQLKNSSNSFQKIGKVDAVGQPSDDENPKLTRGRTLILPPIKTTKEMVKKRR